MNQKILIIGNYADFYSRNYIIINALKEKFRVDEVCLWREKNKKWEFFKELWRAKNKYDYILVLKEGQRFSFLLFLYKLFFKSQIIFDAFISFYDTYVFDRKIVKRGSVKSIYLYFLDWLSCRVADILIFDTVEHQKYFNKTFRFKNKKEIILPVPIDLALIEKIAPKKREARYQDKFIVFFYGYYIPLQGVEYIVEAANLLKKEKNIFFFLLGSGQTRKKIEEKYKENPSNNLRFLNRVDYEELISYIKMADLNLGIFGNTNKAKRVIPNKVLEAMGVGKLVLSGRNKAMEKYFKDREDILYCNMADAQDLAKKIKYVYNNYENLKNIGKNSKRKIEKYFSEKAISSIVEKEF